MQAELFAQRLKSCETSAIRELFKLLGRPGIISFAGGFPDPALFDAEGLAQAAQSALGPCSAAVALQYGATEGLPALKDALSALAAAKGAEMAAQDCIVTTGSQQALDLVAKCMISEGDTVLVEAPSFLAAIQCFRLYGARVLGVDVDAQGVLPDRLEALMRAHRPKLVYLIPTYGNPSGATLSLERRLRVLELAARHQTLVVEDDPYGDLYFAAPPPPSLLALSARVAGSRQWLAHCGSLSKILSPGLRLGWLAAPPELLARAVMCKQFSDANTSTLAQAIAAAYLQSGRLAQSVQRMRQSYAARALCMAQALRAQLGDRLDFAPPQGGMFIWARLTGANGAPTNSQALAARAIEQGVAFVPGAPFYAQNPDVSCLRMSFATADEAAIAQGVQRLAQAMAGQD